LYDLYDPVQEDGYIFNLTKQMLALGGNYGNEIRTSLAVVIVLQTD